MALKDKEAKRELRVDTSSNNADPDSLNRKNKPVVVGARSHATTLANTKAYKTPIEALKNKAQGTPSWAEVSQTTVLYRTLHRGLSLGATSVSKVSSER
jgi:hypothetical protein